MRPLVRALAFALLLGAALGLCVHYGAVEGDRSQYPTADELAADYDGHVGEEALVFGTVREVDESAETAAVEVEHSSGRFELAVRGFATTVRPGGVVQVYGVLDDEYAIEATNVEVVNPAGGSKTYKYAVSAVGAVLVLALFFREWRFDAGSLAFEVRDDA